MWVFGSQSILGQFPDAPDSLRQSAEADVAPRNFPERVDDIDGALGELSSFHQIHGFYVHGLSIGAATLPRGWEQRARPLRNENTNGHTGYCLEAHDVAASKLVAFRDKDRDFVRVLLAEGLVQANRLVRMLGLLPVDVETRRRLTTWVDGPVSDLPRKGIHRGRARGPSGE